MTKDRRRVVLNAIVLAHSEVFANGMVVYRLKKLYNDRETIVHLALDYGRHSKVTDVEIKEVMDMTLKDIIL